MTGSQLALYTESPWGLAGTNVSHLMLAQEAIAAGGLDWDVKAVPIRTEDNDPIPDYRAVQRLDNRAVFSVVSKAYKCVQNRDAFTFFDRTVASGHTTYDTVGCFEEGKVVWLVAQLSQKVYLDSGSELEGYLVLTSGHDGATAVHIAYAPFEKVHGVVLPLISPRRRSRLAYQHRGMVVDRVENASGIIGMARAVYEDLETDLNVYANIPLRTGQFAEVVAKLFPMPPEPEARENHDAWARARYAVTKRREKVINMLGGDTRYDALIAICEWADKDYRGPLTRRLRSLWFGERAKLKSRAARLLAE